MTDSKPTAPPIEQILLLIAAFLSPLIGGHVSIAPRPITEGFLGEIFGGGSLPYLSRLILGLLILGGLATMALRNRVIQLPNVRIIALLTVLVFVLGFSILFGSFRYAALGEWLTWFIYGGALFLTVGAIGRDRGPLLLASALSAGITVAAVRGILEYTSVMAAEPTYRIFAGWNNPNAAASMFVAGTLLLIGIVGKVQSPYRYSALIASSLSFTALILTQSKGGYLAFGVGLFIYLATLILRRAPLKQSAISLGGIVLGAILVVGLSQAASSANKTATAAPLSRITASGSSAEQSVGFRQNLWKSAIQIATAHPAGLGPGTFRFYSTQPGIIESTVFAHQAYLQLAVEGGWLSLMLFTCLAGIWLTYAFRGIKKQPAEHTPFRAAAIAATLGIAAHGFVESNFSFIGSGLAMFFLVGLTLQLSTDGSSPEAVPRQIRLVTVLVSCVFPIFGLAIYAAGESQKSAVASALSAQDIPRVIELGSQLKASNYGDPESLYMYAIYAAPNIEERLEALRKVVPQMPQSRVIRTTARTLAETDRLDEAIAMNDQVFDLDPNNLKAHAQRTEFLLKKGERDAALDSARKTIAVETQTSFQTRAIPELIPTETLEARLLLAESEQNPETKRQLLEQALAGYQKYFEITAPIVKRMTDAGLPDYGGETRESVTKNQEIAKKAVQDLTKLYSDSGVSPDESGSKLKPILTALEFTF